MDCMNKIQQLCNLLLDQTKNWLQKVAGNGKKAMSIGGETENRI